MASYVVSAQYAEVAVKGRKRSKCERVLARNLRDALNGRFFFTVKQSRLLTYVNDLEVAREVAAVAAKVPGVRWAGVRLSVERDINRAPGLRQEYRSGGPQTERELLGQGFEARQKLPSELT